jgi:hypothetical protein
MSLETPKGEASPAPAAQAANPGDVKKVGGNVSMAKAVERLRQAAESAAQAKQKAAETPPAAEATPATPATPTPETSASESAQTTTPEATPSPAQAPDKTDSTEGGTEPGDEAEDPVLSPKSSLSPEQREIIQKRIDREVAKRYKLKGEFEAKIEALSKQVQELGTKAQQPAQAASTQPAAPSADPLPHIASESDLHKLTTEAKQSLRWAEEQLDYDSAEERESLTIRGESVKPTNAMLKRIMRNARETLDESIPAKRAIFQQQAQMVQKAAENRKLAIEKFPFLSKPDSAEFKLAQQVYQTTPWLQSSPEGELYAAAIAKGLSPEAKAAVAEKAKEEPKAAPVAKVTAKPPSDQTPVSTAGAIQRLSPDTARRNTVSAENERLLAKRGITARDAAAFLAHREQLLTNR